MFDRPRGKGHHAFKFFSHTQHVIPLIFGGCVHDERTTLHDTNSVIFMLLKYAETTASSGVDGHDDDHRGTLRRELALPL